MFIFLIIKNTKLSFEMSSYEDMFKNICRLCLRYYKIENMVSLIYNKNSLSDYAKAVTTFANISIQSGDNFPKKMCLNCLFLLKQAIVFKLKCESSEKQLKSLMSCVEIAPDNIKEKIVEYSMFQLFFPTKSTKVSFQNKPKHKPYNSAYYSSKLKDYFQKVTKNRRSDKHSVFENTTDINEQSDKIVDTSVKDDQFESPSMIYDQNPQSGCETGPNGIQNDEQLLDILGTMIEPHSDMLNDNFEHCKKRKLLRRRKLLKQNKHTVQDINDSRKSKKTSLVCKVCRKVLANQHTYEHHMQRHNGCRYICEHCGKGFPVSTELNIHRIARHGTGPYLQCQHCSFKAPRKFDLIEHERIHTGERPYTCDKCGLTFRRRGIWRKHLLYHMEKKVQCTQCSRKFYQRSEMLAHANNVHNRMYVYLCNKCGATYAKPATVRRHLTERHGIPREIQGKVIRINKGSACQEQTM